jgi:hypothetical protein
MIALSIQIDAIKKYLNRVQERYRSYQKGRQDTVYEIVCDANQMTVSWSLMENERGRRNMRWNQVISITAFKRDLGPSDLLRF